MGEAGALAAGGRAHHGTGARGGGGDRDAKLLEGARRWARGNGGAEEMERSEARRGEGGSVCGGGALLRSFLSLSSVREVEDGVRGRRRRELMAAHVQIGRIWADRPKNWAGAPPQSAAQC